MAGWIQIIGHNEVCPEPSLFQAKQAHFPQPFFIGEVLQPCDHLSGPPRDLFQELCVLLVLGAPGLDTVLQMGPHNSWVEGDNHLPLPAGHSSFNAAQNTVGLPGCKRALLAHVQLFFPWDQLWFSLSEGVTWYVGVCYLTGIICPWKKEKKKR